MNKRYFFEVLKEYIMIIKNKEKIMIKNKMFTILLAVIFVFLIALSYVFYRYMKDVKNVHKVSEIQIQKLLPVIKTNTSPNDSIYLGDGYDMVKMEICGNAFNTLNTLETTGSQYSNSYYTFIKDEYDLRKKLKSDFNIKIGFNYWGFDLQGNLSKSIINNTSFSSNTTTIMSAYIYHQKTVILDGPPQFSDQAKATLRFNKYTFRQFYGDEYVQKVDLGGLLYLVLQAKLKEESKDTTKNIQGALEVKFNSIFNGNISADKLKEVNEKLSDTVVLGTLYSTAGVVDLRNISTRKDFLDAQNDFKNFYLKGGELSVINQVFAKYDNIDPAFSSSSFVNIEKYIDYKNQWEQEKAMIKYVKKSILDRNLKNLCDIALENIIRQEELKCITIQPDARGPLHGEFKNIYDLWSLYQK